ncbi:MAG: hypothetical protein ACLRZ8_10690 [Blautia sp.]
MTDKLTDSIAGMADEVLEKWEDYQDKTEQPGQSSKGDGQLQEHEYKARDKPSKNELDGPGRNLRTRKKRITGGYGYRDFAVRRKRNWILVNADMNG